MSGDEREARVPEDGSHDRLDRWLPQLMDGLSRAAARRLIDAGGVYVNGARCRVQGRQVGPGTTLRAVLGADRVARIGKHQVERRPPTIVYVDECLLVVDKPPGMPAQASRATVHGTVERWARGLPDVRYVALHHRLDQDAQGLLALAIAKEANKELARAFSERIAERRYLALVTGVVTGEQGTWHHGMLAQGDRRQAVAPREGLPEMLADWAVRERGPGRTLLEVKLHTGRTHQVRLQAAASGHPIVGDRLYGASDAAGLRLQACSLSLPHPVSGAPLHFALPQPDGWSPG